MTAKITWANETRKLSELKPWTRNPRQIDKAEELRVKVWRGERVGASGCAGCVAG